MLTPTCPRCGAPAAEPKRYCPSCGASLAPAQAARGRRAVWLLVGAAGCLGLLLLLAFGGLLALSLRTMQRAGPATPLAALATARPAATAASVPATAAAASDVLLADDFANERRSRIVSFEDEDSRYAFEDGAYVIELKQPDTLVWANTDGSYGDVVAAVDVSFAADAPVAAAGLIFHYQDPDNFYLFSISSDGYYALDLLQKNEWKTLIDWTQSDAIAGARNTLRVELRGDRIALLANGGLLEETRDDTLSGGDIALALSSFEARQTTISFDNLLIIKNS